MSTRPDKRIRYRETETCPLCGNEYKQVSQHWVQSDCSHPELSDYQREVVTGCLMGDGCVHRSGEGKNPWLHVSSITVPYLTYLFDELGWLSSSVTLHMTAEESARQCRDTGFSPNARAENYHDRYLFYSKSAPGLVPFYEWYESGSKVWPADIELTPTVLKHWYCGDGSLRNGKSPTIVTVNEFGSEEKIESMLSRRGLPVPNWRKRGQEYTYNGKTSDRTALFAYWPASVSDGFWEYIGDPLPGFEYKWPEEYR